MDTLGTRVHCALFYFSSVFSELEVEEDVGYVELEIRRSYGTFGEISVDLNTVAGSAVSPTGNQRRMIATPKPLFPFLPGDILSFSVTQLLETTEARKWYQFSRDDTHYLFLVSSSLPGNSTLYEWRGAFVPVQSLSTYGASAAAFLSVDSHDFLVVSNYGTAGNRETNSTVYEFSDSGLLEEVKPSNVVCKSITVPPTGPRYCYRGC